MSITARAAIFDAASPSVTAISNAVALASSGDTIRVPAGDVIWTNYFLTDKGVSIIGAGIGSTIIRDYKNNNSPMWNFTGVNTFSRLAHMTLVGGTNADAVIAMGVNFITTNSFRVDHIRIENLGEAGIQNIGWSVGLIDHCSMFARAGVTPTGVSTYGFGSGSQSGLSSTNENPSWDTIPLAWGTTNRVWIEDCVFGWIGNGNGAVDAYNGARYGIRYCTITNVNIGAHGTDSSGSSRGLHSADVYANTIHFETGVTPLPFSFRGGTARIFSNIVTSVPAGGNQIRIDNYKSTGTNIYSFTTFGTTNYVTVTGAGTSAANGLYSGLRDPLHNVGTNFFLSSQFSFTYSITNTAANEWTLYQGGTALYQLTGVASPYGTSSEQWNVVLAGAAPAPRVNFWDQACCLPYGPTTFTNIYGGKGFGEGTSGETNGYPGYDQIGRTSPTTYTTTNTLQKWEPLRAWANLYNGADSFVFGDGTAAYNNVSPYTHIPRSDSIMIEGRDMTNAAPAVLTLLEYPHPWIALMDNTGVRQITGTFSLTGGSLNSQ